MTAISSNHSGINYSTQFEKINFDKIQKAIAEVTNILASKEEGNQQSGAPQLPPPGKTRNYEIELSAIMSKIAETLTGSAISQLEKSQESEKVKFEKKMEEMQQWLEDSRKSEKWGLFGKIMSYVGGALAIIGGAVLVATGIGAGVGVALIVGGAITITDQALKDTGALEGGFAGALASMFESFGVDKETAKWLGLATYILAIIVASAGAGAAAGAMAGSSGAATVGTAGAAANTARAGSSAAGSIAANSARAGTSAAANTASNTANLATKLANSNQLMQKMTVGTTIAASMTGASANLVSGIAEGESLKHLASAQEIAAMLQEIALTMEMRKEDLEEALQYLLTATSRISNMMAGTYEAEQAMVHMRTGA